MQNRQSVFFKIKTWKLHQKALKICSGNSFDLSFATRSGQSIFRDTIPLIYTYLNAINIV
jgi:hypothetical protein